jgi:hypothetical protein
MLLPFPLIGLAIFSFILVVPFSNERRSLRILFLLGFAAFSRVLALVAAWILGITLFSPQGGLAQLMQDRHRLLQGHIDFLMMAHQLLFIFAGLFKLYAVAPPRRVLALCCSGAFFNAFGLARAGFRMTNPSSSMHPIYRCASWGRSAARACAVPPTTMPI